VYLLEFDQAKNVSVFGINISTAGSYVFFTEHMPAEFESSEHFFKDDLGRDVEPVKTEPEYDEHHHGEYDPHFWLDFTNDVIVVNAIAETLSQKDPVNSEYYFANAKEYTRKLVALDDAYKQGLASCKTTEFISGGHSVYNYLSQRYGLTTHSIYGLSPDSEPTPQTIKDIIDLTREHNLKYILFEELVNPSIAQSIAQQTNTKTLAFSPGENLGKEEFESGMTFFTLMEGNLNTLRIVLACE
jgi:zinc transport system substrate-binding protein